MATGNPTTSPRSSGGRTALHVAVGLVSAAAGCVFIFKLTQFLRTIRRDELQGFAFDPILVYSTVALGFLMLLSWAFLTGQFSRIEEPKHEILRLQDEIDAREAILEAKAARLRLSHERAKGAR